MTDTAADAGPVVVLVDDDVLGLELLRHLVSSIPGVRVEAFADPRDALAWCRDHRPDVVITDDLMPGLLGLDLLRALRAETATASIPIMMITASGSTATSAMRPWRAARATCWRKPIDALEVKARTRNMLAIRRGTAAAGRALALAGGGGACGHGSDRRARARDRGATLPRGGVPGLGDWLAHRAGVVVLSDHRRETRPAGAQRETIFRAAPMHDVGKIGVPDHILLKAGSLDEAEFEAMRAYSDRLRDSGRERLGLLQVAAEVALTHHERWNGTGYPNRRCGEAIPLGGRIVAVAAPTMRSLRSDPTRRNGPPTWPGNLSGRTPTPSSTLPAWRPFLRAAMRWRTPGRRFRTCSRRAGRRAGAEAGRVTTSDPSYCRLPCFPPHHSLRPPLLPHLLDLSLLLRGQHRHHLRAGAVHAGARKADRASRSRRSSSIRLWFCSRYLARMASSRVACSSVSLSSLRCARSRPTGSNIRWPESAGGCRGGGRRPGPKPAEWTSGGPPPRGRGPGNAVAASSCLSFECARMDGALLAPLSPARVPKSICRV